MSYTSFKEKVEKENLRADDVIDIINTVGWGNTTVCATEILDEFTGYGGEYPQDVLAHEIQNYLVEHGYVLDEEDNWVEEETLVTS